LKFPIVTVHAPEEKAAHEAACVLHAPFGFKPEPCLEARLHGKQVSKLGEWKGSYYHYAAVRELGAKNTDYRLIDPRFLK